MTELLKRKGDGRNRDYCKIQSKESMAEPLLTVEELNYKVSGLYETLNFCLFMVFTTLELVILMGIMLKSQLVSYCYWSFGVFFVNKDENFTDNNNIELYPNCRYRELHPECLNLCDFVTNIENAKIWAVGGLVIYASVTLFVISLYIVTYSKIRIVLDSQTLPKFLFLTFVTWLFCTLLWIFNSGLLNIPDIDSRISRTSTPKNLEANLGILISICFCLFMILYRILLSILIKLTPS